MGTARESVSSNSGNTNAGSAMKMSNTPVRSIRMTSAFISGVVHGASEPNPVVVNVSTTTCSECRNVTSRPSTSVIPQ